MKISLSKLEDVCYWKLGIKFESKSFGGFPGIPETSFTLEKLRNTLEFLIENSHLIQEKD